MLEHVNLVAGCDICEPVRNHQDRLGVSQLVNDIEYHLFALGINVRCGFVKYIDRRVVQ